MTKRILMALALVAGTTSAAGAQTISATANVLGFLDDINSQGMVFGDVAGDATTAASTTPGFMDYRYNKAGMTVDVSVTTQPTQGTETLSLAIACVDGATTDVSMPAAAPSCTGLTLDHTSGMNERRVWVSGTLTGMSTVTAGNYSGVITFQVNGL